MTRTALAGLAAVATFACFTAIAPIASAAPPAVPESPDKTAANAVSVDVSTGLAWLKNTSAYEPLSPYYFVEVAPSYRVSRALSVGAALSYAHPIDPGVRFFCLSGEARYHALRTRAFDAWIGGEAGFAITSLIVTPCGDCGEPPAAATATHVEPLVGAGLGVSVLPIPYVSIGLVGRGMVIGFGRAIAGESELPAGPSPAVFMGLTLGVNVPVGS